MKDFRILSPTAILDYGFPAASFEAGMDMCFKFGRRIF